MKVNKNSFRYIKKERDKFERMYKVQKEMRTHYEELFACGVGELKFANLQLSFYKNLLDELLVISTDEMAKAVIENAQNRAELDKLIHIRDVLPNPAGFEKSN